MIWDPNGLYERAQRRYQFPRNPLVGAYHALRYLYDDAVIDKAEALLQSAEKMAMEDQAMPEAVERVRFLKLGMRNLRLVRDVLKVGYEIKEGKQNAKLIARFRTKASELRALRREMTRCHAIWGESVYTNEVRRKIPTTPDVLFEEEQNVEGL